MLSFHSISVLWFLAFCTCYVHLHTRYIFSSRVIYFIISGLSFCPRLVLELPSFTVRLWFSGSSHSSCKFPRLFRVAVFVHSSCSVTMVRFGCLLLARATTILLIAKKLLSHAHKTGYWYLLEFLFKISD